MTEAALLATVKVGSQTKGAPSATRATEGSRHLIARAHAGSASNPLWVLAWGSMTTIAQALRDDPSIAPKIRIYSIGDYNSTADPAARDAVLDVLDDQPDLWWVENGVLPRESRSTFRGVWRGGNQSGEWHREAFLEQNIRGHGTDAGGRFSQKLGDAFPLANSPTEAVGSLKEGDSPSMLYLLSPAIGGTGDVDDPTATSWGGQFRRASSRNPNHYVDLSCSTKEACQATINRHRVAHLSDWKERWDRYDAGSTSRPQPVAEPVTEPVAEPVEALPARPDAPVRPVTPERPERPGVSRPDAERPEVQQPPLPATGPVLTMGDAELRESAAGRWLTLTAELSERSAAEVTVELRSEDGSAVAGSDYTPQSGTLRFAPGRNRAWVNVWIVGDRVPERDETFTVVLSDAAGASVGTTRVSATILDDDR
jgi:hypothetical protein